MTNTVELIQYPIGEFVSPEVISDEEVEEFIAVIKNFPGKLKNEIEFFTEDHFDTQYRPGGWTVRQLINHLADSHMNAFLRLKLALTEENPTIKPYDEKKFAELQDSINNPVKYSLQILDGLHKRWYNVLRTMTNKQFDRTFYHPENKISYGLRSHLAYYAWHCNHHFKHIQNLKKFYNW